MERYELSLLIESLEYCEKLLERADNRERGLTHGQKHYVIQTALIVMRDLRADFEAKRAIIDAPANSDGIPF